MYLVYAAVQYRILRVRKLNVVWLWVERWAYGGTRVMLAYSLQQQ